MAELASVQIQAYELCPLNIILYSLLSTIPVVYSLPFKWPAQKASSVYTAATNFKQVCCLILIYKDT